MDERLRQTVGERADHRCEYYCLPQNAEPFFGYHIEHIVARQHGGRADSENLALACYHCNAHKGPNLMDLIRKAARSSGCFILGRSGGMSTSNATECLLSVAVQLAKLLLNSNSGYSRKRLSRLTGRAYRQEQAVTPDDRVPAVG